MFRLLKYEFRKTLTAKLIILGVTAVLEIVFLIGLLISRDGFIGTGAVLLALTAIGGTMMIGIHSIVTLHRDMNTRQSYMLFMTPNPNTAILGAKMLENGLSLLLASLFFYALGFVDVTLLFAHYGELDKLVEFVMDFLGSFGTAISLNASSIALFLFAVLTEWILIVATAYFADVVSTALLTGKRLNGLVSFLLFILLSVGTSLLLNLIPDTLAFETRMLLWSVASLALSFVMYLATARLMDRSLSV